MEITRELFEQQQNPRFGKSNPERMQLSFWEWMIRGDSLTGEIEDEGPLAEYGVIMRDGKMKSAYGPWRARDFFNVPLRREDGPIWTFDRMGRTRTELPDGRLIHVGGEHEDFYDPDFYIYNDVVVFTRAGEIEIYGYPREVFAPTDSHTATTVPDRIMLIGGLGYPDDRIPGFTSVYGLSLADYRIERIATSGNFPGWLYGHKAEFNQDRDAIVVKGGTVVAGDSYWRNVEDYELNVQTRVWRRITCRNWPQFAVSQEDGEMFPMDRHLELENIVPQALNHVALPSEDQDEDGRVVRIKVNGITISINTEISTIDIVIEGDLPASESLHLAEAIRSQTEEFVERPCRLLQK